MSKRRVSSPKSPKISSNLKLLTSLMTLALIVFILYVAKPIIIPLALAVLLTFILTPLVSMVQRRGLGRVPATLIVVFVTLILAGVTGWGVGTQLTKLARDLPTHTDEIKAKIARLRSQGTGPLSRLLKMAHEISNSGEPSTAAAPTPLRQPQPSVVVMPQDESALDRLSGVADVVLEPIATAFLVLILLVFMLIRREDLRNRVIGMLGHGHLTGTTRVTVDAGQRVGRFLLAQLCVNAGFGVVFGLGLMLLGVPYWFLWAFVTAVLRFVPYVGTWLAASAPITLSFAISPGWGQPIGVFIFFASLDLICANVIEPILFGHSTGVSPVALLIAAAFWTWIWGPVGLILSTPLTVCLVVVGQHVPRLRPLALLLGDKPALDPDMNFFQRILAGDKLEAAQVVAEQAAVRGLDHVYDEVLIPSLRRMRKDRVRGDLTIGDENFFLESTREILAQANPVPSKLSAAGAEEKTLAPLPEAPLIFACPAHHRAEEPALEMLGKSLARQGLRFEKTTTQILPSEIERRVEAERPVAVVIGVLPPGGLIQAGYLCKRLRKRFPELIIILLYWGRARDFDRLLVRMRGKGANYVTTSVLQTLSQINALLGTGSPAAAATPATVEVVQSTTVILKQISLPT